VQDVKISVRPEGSLDDPARVEGDQDGPCIAATGWRQLPRVEEAEARGGGKDNPSAGKAYSQRPLKSTPRPPPDFLLEDERVVTRGQRDDTVGGAGPRCLRGGGIGSRRKVCATGQRGAEAVRGSRSTPNTSRAV